MCTSSLEKLMLLNYVPSSFLSYPWRERCHDSAARRRRGSRHHRRLRHPRSNSRRRIFDEAKHLASLGHVHRRHSWDAKADHRLNATVLRYSWHSLRPACVFTRFVEDWTEWNPSLVYRCFPDFPTIYLHLNLFRYQRSVLFLDNALFNDRKGLCDMHARPSSGVQI